MNCKELRKFIASKPITESTREERNAIMAHGISCPACCKYLLDLAAQPVRTLGDVISNVIADQIAEQDLADDEARRHS